MLPGIEQPTTSHHLVFMNNNGVLCSFINKNTYYYLKYCILSQIIDCLQRCICE